MYKLRLGCLGWRQRQGFAGRVPQPWALVHPKNSHARDAQGRRGCLLQAAVSYLPSFPWLFVR